MFTRLAPRAAADAQPGRGAGGAGRVPAAGDLAARPPVRPPPVLDAGRPDRRDQGQLLAVAAENDTVAAAFEVSYRHLDPALQRFFAVLGLHPGATTDAYAAAALAGTGLDEATGCWTGCTGRGC